MSKDVKQDDDNVDKNVQLKPQQTKLLSKKNVFFLDFGTNQQSL